MANLTDPITILKGIGPAKAKLFNQLNIFTLEDLICHFPRGYEDRTRLIPVEKLQPDIPACFRAMVMNTPRTTHVRKGLDLTKVQVADHTARLNLTFFNNKFAAEQLRNGRAAHPLDLLVQIHQRQFAHAGAAQRLGAPAAHAAQTKDSHMAALKAGQSLASQKHLGSDELLFHGRRPPFKNMGRTVLSGPYVLVYQVPRCLAPLAKAVS